MSKYFNKDILIFLGLAVVILWQMLLPGYVLTLDMVFTPHIKAIFSAHDFLNGAPLSYSLQYLSYAIPGWIIQKVVLVGLFFCLGYLAYRYLPVPDKYQARYGAALLYTVNPFVYERMLAGHWTHLFAYAVLPVMLYYLWKLEDGEWGDIIKYFVSIFVISLFSLHFLVIAIFISVVWLFFIKNLFRYLSKYILGAIGLIIASSFWLVPYFLNRSTSVITSFNQSDWLAYRTAGGIGNILTLYGFWGENYNWKNYWLWPQGSFVFWVISLSLIIAIIIFGLKEYFQNNRRQLVFLSIIFISSLIFSCGLGETIFKPINELLFASVSFWSGFRDTQKWSGVLALVYSTMFGFGVAWAGEWIDRKKVFSRDHLIMIILFLPFFYTYTMVGGFARQLQPVWYPDSWVKANEILNQQGDDKKVMFFPWHGYLSLDFNNKIILANPAKQFFDRDIVQSETVELGDVFSRPVFYSQEFEKMVMDSQSSPDDFIDMAKKDDIGYIIAADDLLDTDPFKYGFLKSDRLIRLYDDGGLKLLKIGD